MFYILRYLYHCRFSTFYIHLILGLYRSCPCIICRCVMRRR